MGAEPEVEADVAEIEALQQSGAVDLPVARDEVIEEPLQRSACGGMALRQPEGDEKQQRPRRGSPTPGRPLPVFALVLEELGSPALLADPGALALPSVGEMAFATTLGSLCATPLAAVRVLRDWGGNPAEPATWA